MNKISTILILFCGLYFSCQQQDKIADGPLQYFELQDVQLLESPFKHAEELDKGYLLDLDADRLLAPFLKESGLEPKAENYTNWENTGLDGHIGGHYVSALSLMYASTKDKDIKERLDYVLSEIKRCQDANGNGYVSGVPGGKEIWQEIAEGNIDAGAFSLNHRWVPLYNIHKIFNGLRDAYVIAGDELAKEMLIKLTDWMISIVSELSDEQIQDMLRSEHGGLNEVFADVASISGDDKYLQLAKRFSHRVILDPLIEHDDQLTGKHANTQIPKVIGYARVAELNGDSTWMDAAKFFWDEVVKKRSVAIGGNSAYEHFHPEDDYSRMIHGTQGPETCNTYNMLRLTKMLYQDSKQSDYMNYYERALYNHILSSQNPNTGGLVYFTQMRPGHYRVYSQPQTSFWCCVGSGIENHAKYGEMIYAHTDHSLYVNLFIPSKLSWEEKGIEVVQENDFPTEQATHLTINTSTDTPFMLKVRYPNWVKEGSLGVKINGEEAEFTTENGYAVINRTWSEGDKIDIELPMHMEAEQLPDGSNYYAFVYGPIVLAAKTDTEDMKGLFADDSRGGHIASGKIVPLADIPILLSEGENVLSGITPVEGNPLHFNIRGFYPESVEGLELIPFYQLHESRYILYFPQANEQELQELQNKIAEAEVASRKLDELTVDVVSSGEQQPESDHFIKQEHTWTGYEFENLWREGSGWFSYQMKNTDKQAKYLYIKYLDIDANRGCDIFINETLISNLHVKGDSEEKLETYTVEIPESLRNASTFDVKIQAEKDHWMMKVAEVRLLNKNISE